MNRSVILLAAAVLAAAPTLAGAQQALQAGTEPATPAATNYTPLPTGRSAWTLNLTTEQARALADFLRQAETQKEGGGTAGAVGLLAQTKGDYCVRCGAGGKTQDFQSFGDLTAAAQALNICQGAYTLNAERCTP